MHLCISFSLYIYSFMQKKYFILRKNVLYLTFCKLCQKKVVSLCCETKTKFSHVYYSLFKHVRKCFKSRIFIMLLKKSFTYSEESQVSDLRKLFGDRLVISMTRDEFNTLCICLARLLVVEPKYQFYKDFSHDLLDDFYTFEK